MKPDLLKALHNLQEEYADRPEYEVLMLRFAASLIELVRLRTRNPPPESPTRWTSAQYFKLPDRFELIDGIIHPKSWQLHEDFPEPSDEDYRKFFGDFE